MEIVILTVVLVGCGLFIVRKASRKFSGGCSGCASAGDCGRREPGV